MSKPTPDLEGIVFSRLTVLSRANDNWQGAVQWNCRCECGKITTVRSDNLRRGVTKSCGCYQKEQVVKAQTTHGMSHSPEYNSWLSMIHRCYTKDSISYQWYGARGITVCDSWREAFENFYEDMGTRPKNMTLDRLNNYENYEPGNCRWATKKEQTNNRRKNNNE